MVLVIPGNFKSTWANLQLMSSLVAASLLTLGTRQGYLLSPLTFNGVLDAGSM